MAECCHAHDPPRLGGGDPGSPRQHRRLGRTTTPSPNTANCASPSPAHTSNTPTAPRSSSSPTRPGPAPRSAPKTTGSSTSPTARRRASPRSSSTASRPWRTAPTDREGRTAYSIKDGKLVPNEAFFKRLDARLKAINDAGLLAVPVLVWAHKKGDAGFDLTEEQVIALVKFEVDRYRDAKCLFILAGDARYNATEAARVEADRPRGVPGLPRPARHHAPDRHELPLEGVGRREVADRARLPERSRRRCQHGEVDSFRPGRPNTANGRQFTRPVINLEPPYEGHVAYQSRKPHSAYNVRRAVYQSLLATPVAGFTYGGHGVWSWNTKPGEEPTDHQGTGPAKIWKDAPRPPGATQMGYVRQFFESLPWTELRPAQSMVGAGQR